MITLAWTVLFCLGWRIITSEGQILYFIRKPFEDIYTDYEVLKERLEHFKKFDKSLVKSLKNEILKHKLIMVVSKPIVLCITCFASVWGVIVFITLNGLNEGLIPHLILNSVSAAFIQTFIWNLYTKHIE